MGHSERLNQSGFGNKNDLITKDKKLYGNYQVYSPEGILMFRCNEKKAKWYLNRNLASIMDESFKIKLNFEPKGLGNYDRPFGLEIMENKCVNCGSESFLTRHHVVPFCYRKHFPVHLKSHNFHDVLSLCVDCHVEYEFKATELKHKLGEMYDSPIGGKVTNVDDNLSKLIKTSRVLLRDNLNIPQNRIDLISSNVDAYLGRKHNKEDLENLSKTPFSILERTHGEIVMEKITDIQLFIEMWRKHFLDNMECKFLPKNWRIENNIVISIK